MKDAKHNDYILYYSIQMKCFRKKKKIQRNKVRLRAGYGKEI